jgi:hypothetical protein
MGIENTSMAAKEKPGAPACMTPAYDLQLATTTRSREIALGVTDIAAR